jgi:hypothetical protein
VEECTKKTDKTDVHNYWNLFKWSFTNNFKELQNIPLFDGVDENKLEQFIKICDNRLDRSKTFLNHMVLLLGFDLTALSILVAMATEENKFYLDLPFHGYVTFAVLLIILIFLIVCLPHYRSDMHAWTAFKEKALMTQKK